MIKNEYCVSSRLWNKFTTSQKRMYNSVMEEGQEEFVSPNFDLGLEETGWDVIRHNFAVIAAFNLRTKKQDLKLWQYLKKKLKSLDDRNVTAREIFERITQ